MSEKISEERLEHVKQVLRDISLAETQTSLIQDNKIYFNIDGKPYRCVMPSQRDQSIAEDVSIKFKRDNFGKYPTKSQLKKELEEKQNINIEELEKKYKNAREKLQNSYLRMATFVTGEDKEIEKERERQNNLREEFIESSIEITELFSSCLENRAAKKYHEYLSYSCIEKGILDDDKENKSRIKWVNAYNSFEEFEKDRSILANMAVQKMQELLLETRK